MIEIRSPLLLYGRINGWAFTIPKREWTPLAPEGMSVVARALRAMGYAVETRLAS